MRLSMFGLLLLFLVMPLVTNVAVVAAITVNNNPGSKATCVPTPITVKMCNNPGMGYNLTASTLPDYGSQSEVETALRQLEDLVKVPCAPFLELFVCSMHLPLCNHRTQLLVKTCKEFCLRIKENCEPLLKTAGYSWPDSLSCVNLPTENKGPNKGLCLRPTDEEFERGLAKTREKMPAIITYTEKSPLKKSPPETAPAESEGSSESSKKSPQKRQCSEAEVRLGAELNSTCAKRCYADFFFYKDDKNFAGIWMLVWSIICLISTCLALATVLTDSSRFRFPERPIVWISICYLLFSLGHIFRYAIGPSISCSQIEIEKGNRIDYRIERGAGQWCALVFLILYFSSMAGAIWWVILTVCWYLCAAKKWAHEALNEKSVVLHLIAWGIPMLKSVVLLILHRIEGDELTHICVVDSSDKSNLLIFVIIPFTVYLFVGIAFLLYALCSSMTVRDNLKTGGDLNFRRLEKVMTKISLFSFLYVIPSLCVLAFYVYEYAQKEAWNSSLEEILAKPECVTEKGIRFNKSECNLKSRPSSAFFMLKIFMSLAVGLPSGLFVWFNTKSLHSWKACFCQTILRKSTKKKNSSNQNYTTINSTDCYQGSSSRHKRMQDPSIAGSSQGKYLPTTSCSNV